MSRNDHGILACGVVPAQLRKRSTDVHRRPDPWTALVTQLVTRKLEIKAADPYEIRAFVMQIVPNRLIAWALADHAVNRHGKDVDGSGDLIRTHQLN